MDLPPPAPSSEPLRLFLADRDVLCPGCGYNVRGIQDAMCPECGRQIELALKGPGRGRGWLLCVLLALGWVLTASAMNTTRTWTRVKQQAQPRSAWLQFGTLTTTTRNAAPVTTQIGPGTVSITSRGSITLTQPAVGAQQTGWSGLVWANVPTQTWISLGWWSGLALLALGWLVFAIVRRQRFERDRLPRFTIATAFTLFGLYAGYHLVTFTQEFL